MDSNQAIGDIRSRAIVLIPTRLKAARLPGKPLLPIAGLPMIVHVWRRAVEADVGPVVVACAEREIADAVEAAGGRAVLTDPALPSGTDRIHAALRGLDPEGRFGAVVNLQGDLPTLEPVAVRAVLDALAGLGTDMATLTAATSDPDERASANVVKAVVAWRGDGLGRALYFTRAPAPAGEGPIDHHIGIYAYTREALARFAALPPSPLERRERLEQLRALENGMTIGVARIEAVPFGVDTPDDLARARALMEGRP